MSRGTTLTNSILEEDIFVPHNLGPDCNLIGRLLYEFGDKLIISALEDGEDGVALDNFLQMLDSFCAHFISDEH